MNQIRLHAIAWPLLLLALCSCSTVQTSDLPPDELQDQIATGHIVKPGDHVSVATIHGITYDLEIIQVTEESITGLEDVLEDQLAIDENADVSMQTVRRKSIEIPVAEITSVQTRELTAAGKAAAATGAVVAVGGIMYFMHFLLPALMVSGLVGI